MFLQIRFGRLKSFTYLYQRTNNTKTMKRSTFILIGMTLTILAIAMSSCQDPQILSAVDRSEAAKENTSAVISSTETSPAIITKIADIGYELSVYELKYEGKTYVIPTRYDAVAVIEHTSLERTPANMDSVVANSVWLEEYEMLGYTQAQPTKQSLESYYNPEVRPVNVSSEEEFIEYHTTPISTVSLQYQSMLF